jgi:L-asparagine transporter-like permease
MQYAIETTFPLIAVCVVGLVLIVWAVIVGLSRMRLWNAQRKEIEARTYKLISGAQANIDAVTLMIGEIAANPLTYETMPNEVSEALYSARRKAAELT